MKTPKIDYTKLSWYQMAEIVGSIWMEMKRRNPIGINAYRGVRDAVLDIIEIADAEKDHPTADH